MSSTIATQHTRPGNEPGRRDVQGRKPQMEITEAAQSLVLEARRVVFSYRSQQGHTARTYAAIEKVRSLAEELFSRNFESEKERDMLPVFYHSTSDFVLLHGSAMATRKKVLENIEAIYNTILDKRNTSISAISKTAGLLLSAADRDGGLPYSLESDAVISEMDAAAKDLAEAIRKAQETIQQRYVVPLRM